MDEMMLDGMTLNEYMDLAMKTAGTLEDHDALLNGAMGLCGEAGEFIDRIKKAMFQGHELNLPMLVEELGDVLWYVACAARGLGVDLETVARRNIEKLQERYPTGTFRVEDSIRRADVGTNEGRNE